MQGAEKDSVLVKETMAKMDELCWNRQSALFPINRRLFCRSTVGDEHLREDYEAMELESWFAL
jgi:hypothetical protein